MKNNKVLVGAMSFVAGGAIAVALKIIKDRKQKEMNKGEETNEI